MFFGLTYFGSCARCLTWTGWRDGPGNRTAAAPALGFLPGGPCLPAVLFGGILVFIDAFIRSRGGWPVFDRTRKRKPPVCPSGPAQNLRPAPPEPGAKVDVCGYVSLRDIHQTHLYRLLCPSRPMSDEQAVTPSPQAFSSRLRSLDPRSTFAS